MFQGLAQHLMGRAQCGRVQTVFASDVSRLRAWVLDELREGDVVPSVVSVTWDEAPGLRNELDAVIEAMAQAALSIWPRWYSSPIARFEASTEANPSLERVVSYARQQSLAFSETWTQRVWERCAKNKLPIAKRVVAAEQVRQLALAIDPHHLVLVVSVLRAETKKGRLQTLARAVEWMAAQTRAPLVFLAPAEWRDRAELDAVNFDAIDGDSLGIHSFMTAAEPDLRVDATARDDLTPASADESGVILSPSREGDASSAPVADVPVHALVQAGVAAIQCKTGVVVEPIYGKPHPLSTVEQHLAKHLAADDELKALFWWNHPMQVLGSGCKVDLLWQAGGLVIEVDGPDHLVANKYNADRRRDYVLLLEGYTTLRITNDAVNYDVGVVIEQIRKVVHHLQAKGTAKTNGSESQTGLSAVAHAHG